MPKRPTLSQGHISFEWSDRASQFFSDRHIFLEYPWKTVSKFRNGEAVRIERHVTAEPFSNMPPGKFISSGAFSYCRSTSLEQDFKLGRYCSLAPGIRMGGQEHPLDRVSTHVFTMHRHTVEMALEHFGSAPQQIPFSMRGDAPDIGHDVWIGRDALLKRGLTIGTGAVIAERALVTKDVPPYAIVAGAPARIIRFRFPEATIEKLLKSQWWDYNFAHFRDLRLDDPDAFLDGLGRLHERGEIEPWQPPKIAIAEELFRYLSETGL